jgi:hypothetical protein
VAGVGAINRGQSRQHAAIPNNHELPRLPVPGAPRPTRDFEDVMQNRFGKWIGPKLANGAQSAQKRNPRRGCIRIGKSRHRWLSAQVQVPGLSRRRNTTPNPILIWFERLDQRIVRLAKNVLWHACSASNRSSRRDHS